MEQGHLTPDDFDTPKWTGATWALVSPEQEEELMIALKDARKGGDKDNNNNAVSDDEQAG